MNDLFAGTLRENYDERCTRWTYARAFAPTGAAYSARHACTVLCLERSAAYLDVQLPQLKQRGI